MTKRILLILTYPFRLIYMVLLFPFKIAYIIISDKKATKSKRKEKHPVQEVEYLYIGKLLFPDCKEEFQIFYNLYLTDRKQFNKEYQINLQENASEFTKLEIIQAFGIYREKINVVDWRGEENANEIERLIELQFGNRILWTNVNVLRSSEEKGRRDNGKFTIRLFKAIDKDLQNTKQRLLFFENDGDSYIFIPTKEIIFNEVMNKAPNDFHKVDDL